jgi:hypothetical protein
MAEVNAKLLRIIIKNARLIALLVLVSMVGYSAVEAWKEAGTFLWFLDDTVYRFILIIGWFIIDSGFKEAGEIITKDLECQK